VFHVSILKEKFVKNVFSQPQLPISLVNMDGLHVKPQAILDRRTRRGKTEILVHWQGLQPSDATWEILENQFPEYALRDKGPLKGEGFVTCIRAQENQQVSSVGPIP
jgi:hypothetical protein